MQGCKFLENNLSIRENLTKLMKRGETSPRIGKLSIISSEIPSSNHFRSLNISNSFMNEKEKIVLGAHV